MAPTVSCVSVNCVNGELRYRTFLNANNFITSCHPPPTAPCPANDQLLRLKLTDLLPPCTTYPTFPTNDHPIRLQLHKSSFPPHVNCATEKETRRRLNLSERQSHPTFPHASTMNATKTSYLQRIWLNSGTCAKVRRHLVQRLLALEPQKSARPHIEHTSSRLPA
jgi:hypothetical protein